MKLKWSQNSKKEFFLRFRKKIHFSHFFWDLFSWLKKTNEAILIILVQLVAIYVLKMLCKFKQNQLTIFWDIMAAVWKNRVSRKTRLKVIAYNS